MPRMQWQASMASYDGASSSSENSYSESSSRTRTTAPTDYSSHSRQDVYRQDELARYEEKQVLPVDITRTSASTYSSTISSDDGLSDLDSDESFEVLNIPDSEYMPDTLVSTPKDFARFFPTANSISIRHDDASLDGNMNLRLDTQVQLPDGTKIPLTLFHLRMHDLKSRTFSLRRYCRDSGREVCNSVRKYHAPRSQRPGLQRSLSNAIASLRKWQGPPSLHRTDSGYGSMHGDIEDHEQPRSSGKELRRPTNIIKLEFSNYAHIEVKRCGSGAKKRYAFEYWGERYSWKRSVRQDGDFTEVSFHLYRDGSAVPSAHIVPFALTTRQAREEKLKGGWVPPCSLWIKDGAILSSPDVSDVIVSTGLMALVDESIEAQWPPKRTQKFIIPITSPFLMDVEYIGPKRLIDEMFNRPGWSYAPTLYKACHARWRRQ